MFPVYNPFYYKPLPEEITIRESDIEGLGIFAVTDIPSGTDLGITHINVPMFSGLIRTPIGGFLNHSDQENCILDLVHDWDDCQIYHVITTQDVQEGEELTLDYGK
jgi:SET domain-containing protein|tara:strand:- start:245 stop:562 length:318 start_codon:yes stop_codon:yes gene_type:complete